jgi:ribosomal protein L19E
MNVRNSEGIDRHLFLSTYSKEKGEVWKQNENFCEM